MKKLIPLFSMALLIFLLLTSCNINTTQADSDKRFELIHSETDSRLGYIKILKDNETGILYLYIRNEGVYENGVGLTVLYDKDGKPLLDD